MRSQPGDVPRHHLLAEHVLAGVQAADGKIGVHEERRRHDDRLEIFLREHLLPLAVVRGGRQLVPAENRVGLLQLRRIDVAERAHLDEWRLRDPQQRASLAADADEPDADGPALDRSARVARHRQGRERRRPGQRLEKVATPLFALRWSEIHAAASIERATRARLDTMRSSPATSPVLRGQQHQHGGRFDQRLVDDEVRALGARLRHAGPRNRGHIERQQHHEGRRRRRLREEPEHEAQTDRREGDRNAEVDGREPRRLGEVPEESAERARWRRAGTLPPTRTATARRRRSRRAGPA